MLRYFALVDPSQLHFDVKNILLLLEIEHDDDEDEVFESFGLRPLSLLPV